MATRIHVEVTEDDLKMAAFEYGLNDGPPIATCCPIAQALNRVAPGHEWHVDPSFTHGIWEGNGPVSAVLPAEARTFAKDWDESWDEPDCWPNLIAFDIDLTPR